MRLLFIFCLFSVMLCVNVFPGLAKAPTTPKILFTSVQDGKYGVYIMNPDGSEQLNLTQHRANDLQAVWSPTGEQILFVSDRGGVRNLYLMDPDGTHVRRVFKFKIEEWRQGPTWAPDGKRIAYSRTNWGKLTSTLYMASLGEQKEEPLVNGSFPAWSPDGTEIACSVRERLTLINVRTGAQKQLLPKHVRSFQRYPSWSAAGDKLAFAWNKHPVPPPNAARHVNDEWLDKLTIYLVNRDGTGLQQLVGEAGPYAQYPTLSPNGAKVLYTQKINGVLQIFKLDVNSGIVTQLTHIGGLFQANAGGDWFDPAYALPVSPQPQLLSTVWGELKKR